jgi:hypothetical protein
MMGLPAKISAMVKRDSADALVRVNSAIEAAEAKLQRLGESRTAVLEAGDVAAARRIDSDIAAAFGDVAALKDRAVILEGKVAVEQRERAEAAYKAAVAAMSVPLRKQHESAVALVEAIGEVGNAAERYRRATANILRSWPDHVEIPSRATPPSEVVSLSGAGELIRRVFCPFEDTFHFRTRRRVENSEFTRLALDAAKTVKRGFAASVQQAGEQWLHDLYHAHDPLPDESEEGEETDQTEINEQTDEAAA